jgi:hypothetical protein
MKRHRVSDGSDEYIARLARNKLSDDDLRTALSREGQTLASYRASVKRELEKNEIINRQVRAKVNISNEDAERYYKLNMKNYSSGERARLRHILFPVPEKASGDELRAIFGKAGAVHERIKVGEDFAKLAIEYSEGRATRTGATSAAQRGTLVKEIEEIALKNYPWASERAVSCTAWESISSNWRPRSGKVLPLCHRSPQDQGGTLRQSAGRAFRKMGQERPQKEASRRRQIPGSFKAEDVNAGTVDSWWQDRRA